MQDSRYVLWNFENILPGKSAMIEFWGGRCFRGGVRTKRWIAFTVTFILAILSIVLFSLPPIRHPVLYVSHHLPRVLALVLAKDKLFSETLLNVSPADQNNGSSMRRECTLLIR